MYPEIDSNQNRKKLLNDINETINQIGFEVGSLYETSEANLIDLKLNKIQSFIDSKSYLTHLKTDFEKTKKLRGDLISEATKWKTYIPTILWYGTKNQYHLWLFGNGKDRKGVIRGDFGIFT